MLKYLNWLWLFLKSLLLIWALVVGALFAIVFGVIIEFVIIVAIIRAIWKNKHESI